MAASEAALIVKYFGRVMSRGSSAVHNNTSKTLGPVTTVASTLERLSEAPKRPASFAQAEVDADARRMLAFLQRHGTGPSSNAEGATSQGSLPVQPFLYARSLPDGSRVPNQDHRYRNAGQTLQMSGLQTVASTEHS